MKQNKQIVEYKKYSVSGPLYYFVMPGLFAFSYINKLLSNNFYNIVNKIDVEFKVLDMLKLINDKVEAARQAALRQAKAEAEAARQAAATQAKIEAKSCS